MTPIRHDEDTVIHLQCTRKWRRARATIAGLVMLTACVTGGSPSPVGADANEAPGAPRAARAISAGGSHTCALFDDGSVRCWGEGAYGQLGTGSDDRIGDQPGEMGANLAPIDLGTGRTATAITAGRNHTCAILDNGSAKCWGEGTHGRLGNGSSQFIGDQPGEMGDNLPPIDLGTGRTATAITAGELHTCAILDNGSAKCWGYGYDGGLGQSSIIDIGDQPGEMGDDLAPIDLGTGRTATAITAGELHTCAILDNGDAKCWGMGSSGQLGQAGVHTVGDEPGEMGDNLPPIDLGTGRTATAITAGGQHTCAILDNGDATCWGNGFFGQLGAGTRERLGDEPGEMGDNLPPIDLGTGRTATAITAGELHTCAILDNGDATCWGNGNAGRLGSGTTVDIGDEPGEMGDDLAPVDLGTEHTAAAITASGRHTCSVLGDARLTCWGSGSFGRLGHGSTTDLGDEPGEMGAFLTIMALPSSVAASAVTVTLSTTQAAVVAGATVRYTVRITNTGFQPLRQLALNAPRMSACGAVPTTLAAGASRTIVCSVATTSEDTPVLRRTVTVTTANTTLGSAVSAQSAAVSTHVAPEQRRPDAHVRPGKKKFVGNDRYNVTAKKQTVTAKTSATPVRYTVRVQNDGNVVDSIAVRGSKANRKFSVAYSYKGKPITKKVVAGNHTVSALLPGASVLISVVVTPKTTASPGDRHPVTVRTTSVTDTTKIDVVRVVTVRR